MKRTLLILISLAPFLLSAQPPVKKKNYPSLLWEISGNGLKKTSFLFGTMHVSSKMAFHLADSFYIGIHNADVVALETNPESWQEDMSKYDLNNSQYRGAYIHQFNGYFALPNDYLTINSLKFRKYDKKIEQVLYNNPSTINNLLYRSYGNESSDFEEDTYLDMYIYQCGKKWGKKVAGVEKYKESMKLMLEAYKDAAKDKNRKERSYQSEDGYSSASLQEAYRTGNLDWLDSINRYNSFSSAFDEKFLYRRNEIQASSIDSILKTGQSLFVGVGAAHLPGSRGVIEILRDKGYTLRPIKMGERDSQHKNMVEKLRVPVTFATQVAEDGMYKVDIPGKFYTPEEDQNLDQLQYADMANGSYYMVTRIMTNAWMWGHSTQTVYRVIDSLLYENIPGKIINKTKITRDGYTGIDLTNRTRRGDVQRYNIFVTPFEILVFKMSGTGDYVKEGSEANRFFGSIHLRQFIPGSNTASANWKKFSPSYGGFAVDFPHDPFITNNGNWIFDAEDKATNTQYMVMRTDIHNYHFLEEDTFDLSLMEESFASSDFIEKQLTRKQSSWKGYPVLDVSYKDKAGGVFLARFLIQGPHYYTLVSHGKQETIKMKGFFNSFELRPYHYNETKARTDTSLYYTVKSPVFPEDDEEKLDISRISYYESGEDELSEADMLDAGMFRNKVIENDTTGEKIFVSFYKSQRYLYFKDSSAIDNENDHSILGDSSWIVRKKKKYELPNGTKVWELVVTDTGSSRTFWKKSFYENGIEYTLMTQSDTSSKPSEFVRSFFETFTPADTLEGVDPFRKKTDIFLTDFMSTDSSVHKRALKGLYMVSFDSTDLPKLKKLIASVNWNEKNYLDVKKTLISKLDDIRTTEASDYLKTLFYAAGDTVELQYVALEMLLQQQTSYAFGVFRDIITNEPPVLDLGVAADGLPGYTSSKIRYGSYTYSYDNNRFMDELFDSLRLTKTILPDLLPLLNLDDYENDIMHLLQQMADSNLVEAKEYEAYFSKFFLEAKLELKRQAIAEKIKAIAKAEQEKNDRKRSYYNSDEENDDSGNERLSVYASLLLPFWESKPNVQPVIQQMLSSNDKRLKYRTLMSLIRHGRPYPDSLLNYFAELDEYRYELYSELKELKKEKLFPSSYNNQLVLGKSKLLDEKAYGKPDSVAYIGKMDATVKGKKGIVYFFKYKNKKDDITWKLATVGLLPQDSTRFEFEETDDISPGMMSYEDIYTRRKSGLTGFSETRLTDDKPLTEQLAKELKIMLYSRRKSGKEFYARTNGDFYDTATVGYGK